MKEIAKTPIKLVLNEHTVAFRVGEDDDYQFTASEYAKFVHISFLVYDDKTGEDFCTVANTYSLN